MSEIGISARRSVKCYAMQTADSLLQAAESSKRLHCYAYSSGKLSNNLVTFSLLSLTARKIRSDRRITGREAGVQVL